jgi:hypothetical protein
MLCIEKQQSAFGKAPTPQTRPTPPNHDPSSHHFDQHLDTFRRRKPFPLSLRSFSRLLPKSSAPCFAMAHLDPHERPPDGIRNIYKQYQKMKLGDLELDSSIIDLSSHVPASLHSEVRVVAEWRREDVTAAFCAFSGEEARDLDAAATSLVPVYEHKDMPGRASCWIPCVFPLLNCSELISTSFHPSPDIGRFPHRPLSASPFNSIPPAFCATPWRSLQPRASHKHTYALHALLPTKRLIILLPTPHHPISCSAPTRPNCSQTPLRRSTAGQETSLDHTGWSVRLDKQTIPRHSTSAVPASCKDPPRVAVHADQSRGCHCKLV